MAKRIIRSRNRNLRKSNRNKRKSIKRRKLRTIKGGSKVNKARDTLVSAQNELEKAKTESAAAQKDLINTQARVIRKKRNHEDRRHHRGQLGKETIEFEDEKTGWVQSASNRLLKKTDDRVALLLKHGISQDRIDGTGDYKGLGMFASMGQRQKTAKLLRNIQKTKKKWMATHHKELPTKKQTVAHTAEMEKFKKSLTKIIKLSVEEPNQKLFSDFLFATNIEEKTNKLIDALKKKDGEAAVKWLDDIKDQYNDMDAITIVTTANERIAKSMAALKLKVEKAQTAFNKATTKDKQAAGKRLRKEQEAERKLNELVTSHWYIRLLDTLRTKNVLTVRDRMEKIKDALFENTHIEPEDKKVIDEYMEKIIVALGGLVVAETEVFTGDNDGEGGDNQESGTGGEPSFYNSSENVANVLNKSKQIAMRGEFNHDAESKEERERDKSQKDKEWANAGQTYNNESSDIQAIRQRTLKLEQSAGKEGGAGDGGAASPPVEVVDQPAVTAAEKFRVGDTVVLNSKLAHEILEEVPTFNGVTTILAKDNVTGDITVQDDNGRHIISAQFLDRYVPQLNLSEDNGAGGGDDDDDDEEV